MAKYGMLIDLDRCVGCRTHEIVCKKEGNEVVRQSLVTITRTTSEGNKVLKFLPFVQERCGKSKSCVKRVAAGLKPGCVEACPAQARKFGQVDELVDYLKRKKMEMETYIIPF